MMYQSVRLVDLDLPRSSFFCSGAPHAYKQIARLVAGFYVARYAIVWGLDCIRWKGSQTNLAITSASSA